MANAMPIPRVFENGKKNVPEKYCKTSREKELYILLGKVNDVCICHSVEHHFHSTNQLFYYDTILAARLVAVKTN